MNNIEQETICFQINLELGRFPGNHDYHVTYDPRCREIGVQLGELGVQWVPVDAEKFYSWLHNTPGLKWTDEFCRTLDDIARKGVELDTLQAAKETAMQQVLTEHDPKISELAREIARLTKMAEQWASPRRDELFVKGRKSGTTALTTYGYRLGQPSLKPAPGWTWDKVVALLKSTRRRAYLVTKVTPDKDAIRLHVKPHKLAKLGMQIKQDETFYVERSTRSDD